jgi:hypothetical protein
MYIRPREANARVGPSSRGDIMNRIIVVQFITLDGVVEDPDGSGGSPAGGWAFRFGPEAVAGDSVVHTLMGNDLVDEYRLLVFPTVLGNGRRLFDSPAGVPDLRLTSAEQSGAAALLRYERAES